MSAGIFFRLNEFNLLSVEKLKFLTVKSFLERCFEIVLNSKTLLERFLVTYLKY